MLRFSPPHKSHSPLPALLAPIQLNLNLLHPPANHPQPLQVGREGQERTVTADTYVAALDVPGIQRLLPTPWRTRWEFFDNVYKLVGVPVITVQLRYDGWVTEMSNDPAKVKDLKVAKGIDNLLYSADTYFR
jgi:zeta-carotene desaturase